MRIIVKHNHTYVAEPKNVENPLKEEHWLAAIWEVFLPSRKSNVLTLIPWYNYPNIIVTKWIFRNKLRNKERLVA